MYTGRIIRKRREALEIPRSQLAKYLNISEDYLKKIENGSRRPCLTMLSRISVLLEMPLYRLFQK